MSKRKILFVGDLRTAYNYGAIATTETLLDLVRQAAPTADLKLIDVRSFSGHTPPTGWPPVDYREVLHAPPSGKAALTRALKRAGLYDFAQAVRESLALAPRDNVPARFDAYSRMAEKILNGEQWAFEKNTIEWADVVLINSEGNIVNGTDAHGLYRTGGRYVCFFAWLAKMVFHKPCYIINHTVDPQNRDIKTIIQNVYPCLDGVYVREKMSCELLRQWHVENFRYVPDALWTHDFENDPEAKAPVALRDFDFMQPYICIGDSSGIQNNYSHVKWDVAAVYTELIAQLRRDVCPRIVFVDGYNGISPGIEAAVRRSGIDRVNLKNCSYHELYYVLKHARLFISGRWHASIIALLGHTPILLWGSDSHKTEALYGEVGYRHEFFDVAALPLNIDRVAAEAKAILADDMTCVWNAVEELKRRAKDNTDMLLQ